MRSEAMRMAKVIEIYGRKPGMDREAFLAYQNGAHMETVGKVPEFGAKIRKSAQNTLYVEEDNVSIPKEHPAVLSGKDTVVEIFFDSAEEAVAAFHDPHYLEVVRADEEYFSDTADCWSMLSEEHIILDSDLHGSQKVFLFLKRNDMEEEEFQKQWAEYRNKLIQFAKKNGAQKAVENYRMTEIQLENAGRYDFALEFWCDRLEDGIIISKPYGLCQIINESGLFSKEIDSLTYLAQEREVNPK